MLKILTTPRKTPNILFHTEADSEYKDLVTKLSFNKAKSALLTLLNQSSYNFLKSNTVLYIFTTNYILFQK